MTALAQADRAAMAMSISANVTHLANISERDRRGTTQGRDRGRQGDDRAEVVGPVKRQQTVDWSLPAYTGLPLRRIAAIAVGLVIALPVVAGDLPIRPDLTLTPGAGNNAAPIDALGCAVSGWTSHIKC